ncbi:MAG: LLM class flavin-dependent oxidoreductase [Chloroflexi bacterium]|nr:LLM class flavin-dependent oxidoreductase [Chloroflexota bacterium]
MSANPNNRIGFGLLGAPAVLQMVELACLAEERGFESVWVAETRLTRDGIAPCAAIALGTSRIKIATGIVNVYTRGAVLIAVSFVSLDEVSQGRIIMGLGTGSPLVLLPQGVAFDKPLTRLRETIDVVQALLRGEEVSFAGETFNVAGAKLEMPPPRPHIPLYLGVTGPKALELAGEKGDGVMLNAFLPTTYVERALTRIETGAKRAGKTLADVDIAGAMVVSVDVDSKAAKDRSRQFIGLYLSLFPNIAQETGLPNDLIERTRAAFNQGGPTAAAAFIDDNVVDYLTASGTPIECRRRINEYRAAGMQMPILFPLDPNVKMAIETLGPLSANS